MNEGASWITLNKPPVIVAIFQLKFEQEGLTIADISKYDAPLMATLPKKSNDIIANFDMPETVAIGVSKVSATANAKINGYTYFSNDQKTKLSIREDSLTFMDEADYLGWQVFVSKIESYLDILSPLLENKIVTRVSIRFINRFVFSEFNNPVEYFNTTISTTEDSGFRFPVAKYGFKIAFQIPDTNIHSIVNQNIDQVEINKFFYLFDIDVLDRVNLIFEKQSIVGILSELREIKNRIFFENLTEKTIDLCN